MTSMDSSDMTPDSVALWRYTRLLHILLVKRESAAYHSGSERFEGEDALLDEMDAVWDQMTPDERERIDAAPAHRSDDPWFELAGRLDRKRPNQ